MKITQVTADQTTLTPEHEGLIWGARPGTYTVTMPDPTAAPIPEGAVLEFVNDVPGGVMQVAASQGTALRVFAGDTIKSTTRLDIAGGGWAEAVYVGERWLIHGVGLEPT